MRASRSTTPPTAPFSSSPPATAATPAAAKRAHGRPAEGAAMPVARTASVRLLCGGRPSVGLWHLTATKGASWPRWEGRRPMSYVRRRVTRSRRVSPTSSSRPRALCSAAHGRPWCLCTQPMSAAYRAPMPVQMAVRSGPLGCWRPITAAPSSSSAQRATRISAAPATSYSSAACRGKRRAANARGRAGSWPPSTRRTASRRSMRSSLVPLITCPSAVSRTASTG
mmetsp:Transcript_34728/g.100006  ORF Transcript_34728/g.100006 Transcript_34728/m.100006 type:complete len:225 (+) Transcript_34728:928-1602(+)